MTNCTIPSSYLFYSNDEKIIAGSSSGGCFRTIATYYISQLNGAVYGAAFDKNNTVKHCRIDTLSGINRLAKSKYTKSNLDNSFELCLRDLNDSKHVFFVGAPCEIFALHTYLDKRKVNKEKLLTADFICHGTPTVKHFERYLSENNAFNKTLDFRFKKHKWNDYYVRIGSKYTKNIKDPFMNLFISNYLLNEQCFACRFKGENRFSDFTMGDFWGVDKFYKGMENPNGTSLVIVRSKGELVTCILKNAGFLEKVSYSLSISGNPSYLFAAQKPNNFNEVNESINRIGLKKTYVNYFSKHNSLKSTVKSFVARLIKKKRPNNKIKPNKQMVGIITDFGYTNFGNRLQNYALRKNIERLGYSPINIICDVNAKNYFVYSKLTNLPLLNKFKQRAHKIYKASMKSGEKTFRYSYSILDKKQIDGFKTVVFGSDQIWNWSYHKDRETFYTGHLGFKNSFSKVAYAASFGTDHIDDKYIHVFKEGLQDFKEISVREEKAVEILNNQEIASTLVLDPTLLLAKEDWDYCVDRFSSINTLKEKYSLIYCLRSKIDKNQLSIKYVDVLNPTDKYYRINQFDFIKLIKDADVVYTDSYHAFIFSIIYKKKIFLIERPDMNSRFISLFKLLDLEYKTNQIIDLSKASLLKIEDLKQESLTFLVDSLN